MSDRGPAMVLTAIAFASIAAGAIHVSAAATLGRDSAQNVMFFGAVAAAQIAWGAIALARAGRSWLGLAVLGNLAVMATWFVSRTVGLPFGPYAHITLPVGFPDALATSLEAVIVIGALALFLRGQAPSRAATRSIGATAAFVMIAGALALSGVVSQANAFGSSTGSSSDGGAGTSHGYGGSGSSGSYGSSSGGTTSGGGYGHGY